MAEPAAAAAPSGGLGGTLKAKFGPLPVWAWLGIITVALLGYWLYEQHKNATSTEQPQAQTAAPEVVVENQEGPYPSGSGGSTPPPKKKKKKRKGFPPKEPGTRKISVDKNETLGQLAKQRHWSTKTLDKVEADNVTAGSGEWTPSTELHKGEDVVRPYG